MSILDFKVTREEWLENIRSINSRLAHKHQIKKWDEFLLSLDSDDVLFTVTEKYNLVVNDSNILATLKKNHDQPEAYLFLNRYVQFLTKQNLKRSTINLSFAVLRSWCAANGVMLYNEYIKRFVNFPKARKELRIALTHEKIRLLIDKSPNGVKGILMVLLSSGMRISECLQLRVSDVNDATNPISIKIRAENTKGQEERRAYISQETWEILQPFLDNKEKSDYIFIKEFNEHTLINFEVRFSRLRKACGLLEKYDDNWNYHVNVHAFRANFHTIATQILNGDIAHALLGHHKYLDTYLRLSPEKRTEMYHKLEPYLTVSDEARQRVIILEKDQQINELKLMKEELDKQKAKIKRLEKIR